MKTTGLMVLLLTCLAGAPALGAQQVFVDENGFCWGITPCFTTIQAGVNNAGPAPATVSVFPGTYNETVDLSEMGSAIAGSAGHITVTGLPGLAKPSVVPPANSRAFFNSGGTFPGDVTIGHFRVTSADRDAINLDNVDGDVKIKKVEATFAEFDGVDVDATGNVAIEWSKAEDNGDDGFQVFAGRDVLISHSRAIRNGGVGDTQLEGDGFDIRVMNGDVTVRFSQAERSGNDGFDIRTRDKNNATIGKVSFLFSRAVRNGQDGVEINRRDSSDESQRIDDVEIRHAAATGNDGDGFQVEVAGKVKVFFTRATDNGTDGFELRGSSSDPLDNPSRLEMFGVTADRNGQDPDNNGDGIDASSKGDAILRFVRANNNGNEFGDGIQIDTFEGSSGTVRLTYCLAEENVDNGLNVDHRGDGDIILRNCKGNNQRGGLEDDENADGIDLKSRNNGDIYIINCQANDNPDDGIQVIAGGKVKIINSEAVGNGRMLPGKGFEGNGILVRPDFETVPTFSEDITIRNTKARDNAEEGIDLAAAGPIKINKVCVRDNNANGLLVREADGDISIMGSDFKRNNATGVCLGVLTGSSNVATNSNIAGNGDGMALDTDLTVNAKQNWWGAPSGPDHPTNAGGSGDSVIDSANGGSGTIDFEPFRFIPAFTKTKCFQGW